MVGTAYRSTSRAVHKNFVPIFWIVVLGLFIWGLVVFIQFNIAWHRGIYAGFHRADAMGVAQRVMVATRGEKNAEQMHFASPPAVRGTSSGLLSVGQVWNVHLVGARGEKWCVLVWHPYPNWTKDHKINLGGYYSVKRGCSFK